MADKWRYRERWPERRYQAKPGTVTIGCNGTLCKLTLLADWSVTNPKSGAAMRGVAQYEYSVDWAGSSPRISAEGGSVLSREKLVKSAPTINEWLSKLWSK
jgi:hypothetical protein